MSHASNTYHILLFPQNLNMCSAPYISYSIVRTQLDTETCAADSYVYQKVKEKCTLKHKNLIFSVFFWLRFQYETNTNEHEIYLSNFIFRFLDLRFKVGDVG